jgi:hypothetical protein
MFHKFYKSSEVSNRLVRSVAYLIREAIFRPPFSINPSTRPSLEISSLGELMDMYHTHEATKPHDRIYALLGMCSDDRGEANLLPNYGEPWEVTMQRLTTFLLGDNIEVRTRKDKNRATIRGVGNFIGRVSWAQRDSESEDREIVEISLLDHVSKSLDLKATHWSLQLSARPIREGDIICLLRGARSPSIIRLFEFHFVVIMIAADPRPRAGDFNRFPDWASVSQIPLFSAHDLTLIWDWDWKENEGHTQDRREHSEWVQSHDAGLGHVETGLESRLDKVVKAWRFAHILDTLGDNEKAEETLVEAIGECGTQLKRDYWRILRSQHGFNPLAWAAINGHETLVQLLLTKYSVHPDLRDAQYSRTPLSWSAGNGHESVVSLLLKTRKVNVDAKDRHGWTPLFWAAENGHETVVDLLLETGSVDINVKDRDGQTPLLWAAKNGHVRVVERLLRMDSISADTMKRNGRALLSWATKNGHTAVLEQLLNTGKCTDDLGDQEGVPGASKTKRHTKVQATEDSSLFRYN